jgi:hypothetical protein
MKNLLMSVKSKILILASVKWKILLVGIFLGFHPSLLSQNNGIQIEFIKMDPEFFYTRAWVLSSTKTKSTILLIGVVHVAETQYFREIDDLLQRCEIIFYEGIHPKSSSPHSNGTKVGSDPFAFELEASSKVEISLDKIREEQLEFAQELDLSFQFHILSPKENWILADTNSEDFAKSIQELSHEELSLDKNPLEENPNDIRQMAPDSANSNQNKYFVRRKLAEEITTSSQKINSNPKYEKVLDALVKKRNNIVLSKLSRYLDTSSTLGIIYGAAHMPDFLTRLETEWGYKVVGTRWIPAWSLKKED